MADNRLEAKSRPEYPGRSAAGWGWPVRWGVPVLLLSGLIASCAVLYEYACEQVRRMECGNHLKEIGLALRSYHTEYGAFPPAYLCDKAGKPINSWRTLIVPGRLWYTFPSTYDFAERWDTPRNSRLLLLENKKALRHFWCPSGDDPEPAITNYVAVVGPNTMWPGCTSVKQADDSSDKDKILVIEIVNSDILWMEPRDLTLEQALEAIQPKKGVGIGSRHRDGIRYVTVGGEVRTLDPNIDRESLRKLLVRDSADGDREEDESEKGGKRDRSDIDKIGK